MIISPVNFIECIDDLVYCGIGSYLCIYSLETKMREYYKIFEYQRIHTIRIWNDKIVFNGGYIVCIADRNMCNKKYCATEDWILDIKLADTMEVLSANSRYTEYDYEFNIKRQLSCPGSPISYAACINNNQFVGGSVFGDVHIWDENGIIKKIKAHIGFIFRVSIANGYLLTCSEDRTMKMTCLKTMNSTTYKVDLGRCWNVCVSDKYVFVVSEDAGIHVFELIIPTATTVVHKPLTILRGHEPKHVWSIALSIKYDCFITGGNDGAILQWPLAITGSFVQDRDLLFSSTPPYIDNEHLKYTFAVDLELIVNITSSGRIFNFTTEWELAKVVNFKNNNYFIATHCEGYVLFGDVSGTIHIYNINNRSVEQISAFPNSKIIEICAHRIGPVLHITAQSVDFQLSYTIFGHDDSAPPVISYVDYELRSFAFHLDNLLIGTRDGYVYIYNQQLQLLSSTLAHEQETVADIQVLGKSNDQIISCGRNGNVSFHRLNNNKLELIMDKKITKGWTEKIINTKDGLLFLNFFRKQMNVYSLSQEREILSIDCGGAHRSYSYYSKDISTCHFTFLKSKKLFKFSRLSNSQSSNQIQPPFFGRELRDCIVYKNVILCCGESGFIKGFELINDNWDLKCSLHAHDTVIKGMSINNEILITVGGREIIRAWRIRINTNKTISLSNIGKSPSAGDIEEIRCMCVSTMMYNNGILVVVGYSDAFVRLLYFNLAANEFSLLFEYCVDGSVFCIKLIKRESEYNIICGTSKGAIVLKTFTTTNIFKSTEIDESNRFINKPMREFDIKSQIMRTGIHDFVIKETNEIYCVGDCGYVTLCEYLPELNQILKTREWFVSYSPLSTILEYKDAVYISGLEQNIYKIKDGELSKISKSCIADVSKLIVLNNKLLVTGFGIEMMDFKQLDQE